MAMLAKFSCLKRYSILLLLICFTGCYPKPSTDNSADGSHNASYVKPLPKTPKKLVVLLHGMHGTGGIFKTSFSSMIAQFPDYHFFAPDGEECDSSIEIPVLGPWRGCQWFSLQPYRTPEGKIDWQSIQNISRREVEKLEKDLKEQLDATIKKKQRELKLTNKDTIIIGYSQGAIVGLYLTLIQENPYLATISISGLLVAPAQCINKSTPICLIHGTEDKVIPIRCMKEAEGYLSQHGIQCSSHPLQGVGHQDEWLTLNDLSIIHAINFIKKHSAPPPA